MRCRGLVPKLILTLSVTICITFFIVGIILSSLFREEYYQERLKTLSGEEEVIEQVVNSFMNSETTLGELDKSISFIGDSLKADIYLIDSYGYIYSVSNEKYDYLKRTKIDDNDMKTLKENIPIEQKKKMNLYILNLSSLSLGITPSNMAVMKPLIDVIGDLNS